MPTAEQVRNLLSSHGLIGQVLARRSNDRPELTQECCLRPEWQDKMLIAVRELLGSSSAAESVLRALGYV